MMLYNTERQLREKICQKLVQTGTIASRRQMQYKIFLLLKKWQVGFKIKNQSMENCQKLTFEEIIRF